MFNDLILRLVEECFEICISNGNVRKKDIIRIVCKSNNSPTHYLYIIAICDPYIDKGELVIDVRQITKTDKYWASVVVHDYIPLMEYINGL